MRTTATHMQRTPPTLVKWTYLFLILLAVTVNTFSGELSIAKANPSRASVASGTKLHSERQISNEIQRSEITHVGFVPMKAAWYNLGCIQFQKGSDTCKRQGTSRTCLHYSTQTGKCRGDGYSTDKTLIGCLHWDPGTGDCTAVELKNVTPCPSGHPDPGSDGQCSDGSSPTCGNNAYYDESFKVCTEDPRGTFNSTGRSPHCPSGTRGPDGLCSGGSNPTCSDSSTTYDPIRGMCTPNTNPSPGCPSNYTLQGVRCQRNGTSGPANTIDPTCPQGYIEISGTGCLPNSTAYLIDKSDTCTSISPVRFSCPYQEMNLYCAIDGLHLNEDCELEKNNTDLNFCSSSNDPKSCYVCTDDSNLNPLKCSYWGTYYAKNQLVGNSVCRTTGTGSSALVHCPITTCFVVGSDSPNQPSYFNQCPASVSSLKSDVIQVTINQNCTPASVGQPLTCTYGDDGNTKTANGSDGTHKSVQISVDCKGTTGPTADCTATDPYGRQINRKCSLDVVDPNSYTCYIKTHKGNYDLWIEKCQPPASASPLPHCDITDTNNVRLGSVDCTSASITGSSTCTIKDLSHNSVTLSCVTMGAANGTKQCTSNTPDCPYTDTTAPSPSAPAVTESTIACSGSLLVDLFDGPTTAVTLIYPLSQAELEYVLKQLGVGSQSWKPSSPTVTYL